MFQESSLTTQSDKPAVRVPKEPQDLFKLNTLHQYYCYALFVPQGGRKCPGDKQSITRGEGKKSEGKICKEYSHLF